MLLNQTLRSGKPLYRVGTVVIAIFVGAWWVQQAFLVRFAIIEAARIHTGVPLERLLGLAFIAYTLFLLFSSFLFTLNALLINPDLDLLLPAPWTIESVVVGRMVSQLLRLLVISLLALLPAIVGLPIGLGRPWAALGVLAIIAVYPIIPLVVVTVITLLAIRIVPQSRGREVITGVSLLVALGVNLAQLLFNPALQGGFRHRLAPPGLPDVPFAASPFMPFGWAARAVAGALTGDWASLVMWGTVLASVSALAVAVGVRLSGRVYLAGWIQGVQARRSRRGGLRGMSRFSLPWLKPLTTALVVKDWRMRVRDLAQLARLVMPMIFLVLLLFIRSNSILPLVHSLGPGPLSALLALVPAWAMVMALTTGLGLSAVSLEGAAIWVYVASPNGMRQLLEAKCWSVGLPVLVASLVVGSALELVVGPGWVWAVGGVFLLAAAGAGLASLMVGIGAIWARFDWTDARRMVHPAGALLGTGAQLAATTLIGILVVGSLLLAAALRVPLVPIWLFALGFSALSLLAVAFASLILATQKLKLLQY
jgi:hypothetical protein